MDAWTIANWSELRIFLHKEMPQEMRWMADWNEARGDSDRRSRVLTLTYEETAHAVRVACHWVGDSQSAIFGQNDKYIATQTKSNSTTVPLLLLLRVDKGLRKITFTHSQREQGDGCASTENTDQQVELLDEEWARSHQHWQCNRAG